MKQSKQLQQDVHFISAIIASSPVLAPLQVLSPLQCSFGVEEVSSTLMASGMLTTPQDYENHVQSEHDLSVSPKDESLHTCCDSHQDLTEDLTNLLKREGRLSDSQFNSGYIQINPLIVGIFLHSMFLAMLLMFRGLQQRLSDSLYGQSDDAMLLRLNPPFHTPQDLRCLPADAHTCHSHPEYGPVRNLHDPRFGDRMRSSQKTGLLVHSSPYLQQN